MPEPSTRAYRLLLKAYPRTFRRSYGHRMEVVFASEWKRARAQGIWTVAALGISVLADWLVSVPSEWLDIVANEGRQSVSTLLADLWQDFRHGARGLSRRPALAVVLTVTLGVGIGGVAAIESVLRGTLFRGLPYDEPDRVHLFWNAGSWAPSDLAAVEQGSPNLEVVAAYNATQVVVQGESGPASAEDALVVSRDFFSVFGRVMQMGRDFGPSDEVSGSRPVAVITQGLWAELGRPQLGGAFLEVDGRSVEIVGVCAPDFYFPDPATRIFRPMQHDRTSGDRFLTLIARVSSSTNDVALAIEAQRLGAVLQRGDSGGNEVARFTPVRKAIFGGDREPMLLVAGALTLVLLMAVVNVGALMLAHTERRRGSWAFGQPSARAEADSRANS